MNSATVIWAAILAFVALAGSTAVAAEKVPDDTPPAFFLVANDDSGHVGPVVTLLERYRQAGRPVEVHLYARGGHGFNLGNRSELATIKNWPQRMADWMADNSILDSSQRTGNDSQEQQRSKP
jgi:acetyl esterase/lipase